MRMTSAIRSVPDPWAGDVSTASAPMTPHRSMTSSASVATMTRSGSWKDATRRQTHSSSGLPAMTWSGFLGSRSEPSRAGMTHRIRSLRTGQPAWEGARRDAKFTPKK
jgi:hypothetical protein